ncbi:MAG TPA: mycothiol synthase [Sporichthyaceae bacterium]|nr:mycothiol synthase [Sporichthyaceae bacterium]
MGRPPDLGAADLGTADLGTADLGTVDDVRALAAAVTAADGVEPFSEATWLSLSDADPAVHHLGRHAGTALIGYAQVRGDRSTELAVHPDHRRRGHGRALLDAVVAVVSDCDEHPRATATSEERAGSTSEQQATTSEERARSTNGAPAPRVWSYGGHPAAAVLADRVGLVVIRELWRMSRDLPLDATADPPGPVDLPPDVTVRQFVPGADESAWLAVNSRAFAGHGEQGRLTLADLHAREAAAWFDPAGFFLAERDGELVGFHWTKVHPGHGESPGTGEIYVLAVDPGFGGGGLGRALARIGLRHLAGLGLPTVSLYVDGHNGAAVRVYQRLGFATDSVSVMYGFPHLT